MKGENDEQKNFDLFQRGIVGFSVFLHINSVGSPLQHKISA